MSITHGQILQTAVDLAKVVLDDGSCCEASMRSSTSRAYYAALHAAMLSLPQEFALTLNEIKSANSHEAVSNKLIIWGKSFTAGRTEAQIIARELPTLKKLRKKADYRIDADFTEVEAINALSRARKLIASAELARSQYDTKQTA